MSTVTGLTLICSLADGEGTVAGAVSDNVTRLNDWLDGRDFGPLVDVADYSGGNKHPQCCTFHCGYNNFPEDKFAAMVLSLDWQDPENVVLVLQPEDGPTRVFADWHFTDTEQKAALIRSLGA